MSRMVPCDRSARFAFLRRPVESGERADAANRVAEYLFGPRWNPRLLQSQNKASPLPRDGRAMSKSDLHQLVDALPDEAAGGAATSARSRSSPRNPGVSPRRRPVVARKNQGKWYRSPSPSAGEFGSCSPVQPLVSGGFGSRDEGEFA